jgi:hypothetical protein
MVIVNIWVLTITEGVRENLNEGKQKGCHAEALEACGGPLRLPFEGLRVTPLFKIVLSLLITQHNRITTFTTHNNDLGIWR